MEKNSKLTDLARQLRKDPTKEEALLWYSFLRKCSVRLHRQYVIGNYTADFYCHKAQLVIELDGSQHYEQGGQIADEKRDAYLKALGLTVLRIPNNEINQNFRGVCEYIHKLLQTRT